MTTRIITFSCLFVFLVVASSTPAAGGSSPASSSIPPVPFPIWRSEVAVPGVVLTDQGVRGMALDAAGRPHVVYGSNRLFHAWHDGSSWQVETVDPTVGSQCGPVIAIDDADVITIVSCQDEDSPITRLTAYRHAPGEAWQTDWIPLPQLFTTPPLLSLAMDSTGQPHLAAAIEAFANISSFVYARGSSSGWVVERVTTDHDADGQPVLALDSHDRPVILYGGIEALWLARGGSAGWQHEQVAAPPWAILAGRALALDSLDRAHIIFSNHSDINLTYLRQTTTGWQPMVLADDGSSPSLALDDMDQAHIVYLSHNVYLSNPEGIVYGVYGPEGWVETPVLVGEFGGSANTLLLDDAGVAHITTLQYGRTLHYATNEGGEWAVSLVAQQDEVGDVHTLALDAADKPYLLYYQSSTGQLRWAVREDEGWTTSLVDDVPPDQLELAVGIGPNGVPQIVYTYFDGERNQVIVGSPATSGWDLQHLANDGFNPSLIVDDNNQPHLVLIQSSQVVYWTKQGGVWHSEPISSDAFSVGDAYLALDSQGQPVVVYYGINELKVALREEAGSWTMGSLPRRLMRDMARGPDDAIYLLHLTEHYAPGKPPRHWVTLWLAEQQGLDWMDSSLYAEEITECYVRYAAGVANRAMDSALFSDEFGECPDGRLMFDDDGRLHIINSSYFGWLEYNRRDGDGQWLHERLTQVSGSYALEVGIDGEPRLSHQLDGDLHLSTREIDWLNHHSLLPIVVRSEY